VRVLTTAMSENDFIFGASQKLEETLLKAEELFSPNLVGVVGTCASMIIGEDLKEAVENANINATVLSVESHGGFGEGDNTEGAVVVLEAAERAGLIPIQEVKRQVKMLKTATEIEKTRGMAQGEYIAPQYGDDKTEVAEFLLNAFKKNKKVALVLNSKKETSYIFADLLKIPFHKSFTENPPTIIANLDEQIGLPRIRKHAANINQELENEGISADTITGGLDEYPMTGKIAAEYLKEGDFDVVLCAGVPHAIPIEEIAADSIAVTDGPRLVEPLKRLGYSWVVTELDAHSKTLGTDKIVDSEFGKAIRHKLED
jgi:putative methanogenesis marker 13 metalloprotein